MKSDHNLQRPIALAVALLCAACSGSDKAPEDVPTPAETVKIEPLSDAELMGVPREQVVLTLPWSGTPLSRDPAPNAPRATLQSVEVTDGGGFDRATFTFRDDAAFPGYRVVWSDSAAASCADSTSAAPPAGSLIVRFEPASAKDEGKAVAPQTSLRPGLPSVSSARQLCDRNDKLVWALAATDSARFRLVELRSPPRLLVDVRHHDAEAAAAGTPVAPDSGTAK